LTGVFLFSRDRSFDSNARVFIRLGRESVTVDPTAAVSGQMVQMSDSQKREIQSAIDIFHSNAMHESIVDKIGVDQILDYSDEFTESNKSAAWIDAIKSQIPKIKAALAAVRLADPENRRAKAIAAVEKQIKVKSEADSNLLAIRVRSESPKLSQSIGEIMMEKFQDLHLKAHRAPGAFSFFTDQLEITKRELETAMLSLRDAKNASSMTSIADQRVVLTEKLKGIELAILQANGDLKGTTAKAVDMEATLGSLPDRLLTSETTGLTQTSRDEMRGKLYNLELELAELESKYKSDHPMVEKKSKQLVEARAVFGDENVMPQRTTASNPTRDAVKVQQLLSKADTASATARVEELENRRKAVLQEIRQLNEQENRIESLQREIAVLDVKYKRYSESLEQSRIDEALQRDRLSSVNVIQPPTFDDDPVDISNSIIALGGGFCSLLLGLGAAFARRYFRNDLANVDDVERELELPVLASIPISRLRKIQAN
jgi:uncharacterized protein involved in exopolysaccharide biosynthesis